MPITLTAVPLCSKGSSGAALQRGNNALMKLPFIIVFCHGEKYFFRYKPGQEDELIAVLIDYAMDERLTFGWPEVRSIMRHFGFLKTDPAQAPGEKGADTVPPPVDAPPKGSDAS